MRRITGWVCLLASVAAVAGGPPDDGNMQLYEPGRTLAYVFDMKPRDPQARFELAPARQWYRVEGVTFTGKAERVDPEGEELLVAWRADRELHPEAGRPIPDIEFPRVRVQLEQQGQTFQLWMTDREIERIFERKAPTVLTVFVQRIGFASGKPQVLLFMLGETEEVKIGMESQKRNPPRPIDNITPPPPPPPPTNQNK